MAPRQKSRTLRSCVPASPYYRRPKQMSRPFVDPTASPTGSPPPSRPLRTPTSRRRLSLRSRGAADCSRGWSGAQPVGSAWATSAQSLPIIPPWRGGGIAPRPGQSIEQLPPVRLPLLPRNFSIDIVVATGLGSAARIVAGHEAFTTEGTSAKARKPIYLPRTAESLREDITHDCRSSHSGRFSDDFALNSSVTIGGVATDRFIEHYSPFFSERRNVSKLGANNSAICGLNCPSRFQQ